MLFLASLRWNERWNQLLVMFYNKTALEIFKNFTGKKCLPQSLFVCGSPALSTDLQMLSCELFKFFENTR